MRISTSIAVWGVALLGLLAGASPAGAESCRRDSDCSLSNLGWTCSGNFLVEGLCSKACNSHSECPTMAPAEGGVVAPGRCSNGFCIRPCSRALCPYDTHGACNTHRDCPPPDGFCEQGKCMWRNSCALSNDCQGGHCADDGLCLPGPAPGVDFAITDIRFSNVTPAGDCSRASIHVDVANLGTATQFGPIVGLAVFENDVGNVFERTTSQISLGADKKGGASFGPVNLNFSPKTSTGVQVNAVLRNPAPQLIPDSNGKNDSKFASIPDQCWMPELSVTQLSFEGEPRVGPCNDVTSTVQLAQFGTGYRSFDVVLSVVPQGLHLKQRVTMGGDRATTRNVRFENVPLVAGSQIVHSWPDGSSEIPQSNEADPPTSMGKSLPFSAREPCPPADPLAPAESEPDRIYAPTPEPTSPKKGKGSGKGREKKDTR